MIEAEALEERIRQGVGEVSHLVVSDLTGTKDHWEALIVSEAFSGKSRIQQHQMVYQALKGGMGEAYGARDTELDRKCCGDVVADLTAQ